MAKSSKRTILQNSAHNVPAGSIACKKTNPNKWIELTLGVRRLKDLPELSKLDRVPILKRKYMTHETLAEEYGADPASIKRIQDFATNHGLVVTNVEPASARL